MQIIPNIHIPRSGLSFRRSYQDCMAAVRGGDSFLDGLKKMKENIENMVRQASILLPSDGLGPLYKESLKQLINNLKEVRKAHIAGDSQKVLDAFFEHYVFSGNK
jgi:hypothetical protein